MSAGPAPTAAMQRGDLLLCRHLDQLGLPVTVIAKAPVAAWIRSLPQLHEPIEPTNLGMPAADGVPPGVVVVVDEVAANEACLAAWRAAGVRIARRHGAGWRIEAAAPPPQRRLGDWFARRVPRLAGRFGVLPLQPPFRHDGGHSWWVSLRALRRPRAGDARVAVLFENGRPLAHPDSIHDDIRRLGGGRYSVWDQGLYFSASDGSDPATNGRRYVVKLVTPGQAGELAPTGDEATFAQRFAEVAARRPSTAPSGRRVLIVISSLGPGGAERQFAYLARGLAQRGWQVGILSLDGFEGSAGHYVPMLAGAGVELLDGSRAHAGFAPPLDPVAAELLVGLPDLFAADVWRIASHTAVFAPDVLHCALDKPNVLGAIAGTCLGVPRIVLSLRNVNPSHIPRLDLPWFRRWYRIAADVPGLVLSANSQAGSADYAAWMGVAPQRITTVHNGIDGGGVTVPADAATAELRAGFDLRPDDPVIAGVFRIAEEKRPLLWLDVVAALRAQFPRLQALHVGDGPDAAAMDTRIDALGLRGVVHRLGRQDDPGRVVRAADLLLLVSSFEGVPNVMLEAQWLERPVVCTAAGGAGEAVRHGVSGWVVDEPNAVALAAACAGILADRARARRMGQAGRAFVAEAFAVDRMIDGSVALYR